MKKILIAALGIALIAMASTQSRAASNWADFTITVVVSATGSGILNFVNPDPYGGLGTGQDVFSNGFTGSPGHPRAGVRNIGVATIPDLRVQISNVAGSGGPAWTFNGTDFTPGDDVAVLAGIFTEWDNGVKTIDATCFGTEDILQQGTDVAATTSVFADDTSAAPDADALKGINVPTLGERTMRFRLMTPTAVTQTDLIQQTITITMYNGL